MESNSNLNGLNNPQVLAALRHLLSAVGGALAILGLTTMSPALIDKIMDFVQAAGIVLGALATLLGLLAPMLSAAIAWWKASPLQQIKSAAATANDPTQPQSAEVKIAMVNETAKLPEVDKVVAPPLAIIPDTEPNVTQR